MFGEPHSRVMHVPLGGLGIASKGRAALCKSEEVTITDKQRSESNPYRAATLDGPAHVKAWWVVSGFGHGGWWFSIDVRCLVSQDTCMFGILSQVWSSATMCTVSRCATCWI